MKNKYKVVISIVIVGLLALTGCGTSGNDKETYEHFKDSYSELYQEGKLDYEINNYNQKFEESYFEKDNIDELPVVIYKHEQKNEYVVKVVENGIDFCYGVMINENTIKGISSVDYDKAIKVDGVTKVYEQE